MARLEKILKLRKRLEERAAQDVRQLAQQVDQLAAQRTELADLAADYRARHDAAPPARAAELQQFRAFYGQLHAAVTQQTNVVSNVRVTLEQRQAHFLERRRDRRALQQLLAERALVRKRGEKRANRKLIDDLHR